MILEDRNADFNISLAIIYKVLKQLKITVKKANSEIERVNKETYIGRRKLYFIWFNSMFQGNYSNAVFVDKSPFNLHIRR